MDNPSDDDCITVRVSYTPGSRDKLASVFIKREGRDPTLRDLQLEEQRLTKVREEELELIKGRLLKMIGVEPYNERIGNTLGAGMENPKHNSDLADDHRWNQNPSWPTSSRVPTSRSNPVDLTKSSSPVTNTSTKKQETNLRRTNAGAARSSPLLSTQPNSLGIVSQPKQGSVLQQTSTQPIGLLSKAHMQTNPTAQMSEPSRRKVKAVAREPAKPKSSAKDVGPRPTTEAAAKVVTKASSRSLTKQHAERSLKDFNDYYTTARTVQPKSSPPPGSTRRGFGQYLSATESSKNASTTGKPQDLAQPSFAKEDSFAAVLFDKDEPRDTMSRSSQPLPSGAAVIIGKPVFKRPQPKSSPASSRPLASTTITQQALENHVPTVSSSQFSEHFDDYIKEKLGRDVDDRYHRIIKLAMFHASRWTLQNIPGNDELIRNLHSQIDVNERNSRTVNKAVATAMDACDVGDNSVLTDLYKLLDKQEKERQESLEGAVEKLNKEKKEKKNLMSELDGLEAEVQKIKDAKDKEGEDRLKKHMEQKKERMRVEQTKEQDKNKDDGNNVLSEEESRKRKRDAEKEEHMDINILL